VTIFDYSIRVESIKKSSKTSYDLNVRVENLIIKVKISNGLKALKACFPVG